MYHFYIIYSPKLNKYYYGHTSSLVDRIKKHNSNHKGWTGKANDWKYVYTEVFESKELAYSRELQIKSWKNRTRIESLINTRSDGS